MADPASLAKASYELGKTAMFACKADPRFHYCLYVPPAVARGTKLDLLVAVHGTSRTSFLEFRDGFAAFGRWNNVAILCPIFPIGVRGDGARSGYKYMAEGDIRYDQILLAMVAEVAEKYDQDWSQFAIFGFSGGGHFAHRFAILHPDKLWAASVGASGSVTLLDPDRDWWVGIRDPARKIRDRIRPPPFLPRFPCRWWWAKPTLKPGKLPIAPAIPIGWTVPTAPGEPAPSVFARWPRHSNRLA